MMAVQRTVKRLAEGRLRRGSEIDPREEAPTLAEAGIDKVAPKVNDALRNWD